jgi:thymidine kinase
MVPTPSHLTVICGPMFAGKSTRLLHELARYGGPTLVVKPTRDTRYAPHAVVTHDGVERSAICITLPDELCSLVAGRSGLLVGIDEAHFFGAGLVPVVRQLLEEKHTLVIAGIERDHLGHPFEPFPALLCEADEVVKLTARCTACQGKYGPAIHSQRLVLDNDRILVGGAELYQPRCRHCFTGKAQTLANE